MGKLWTNVAECDYKEYARKLMEQSIHWLDTEGMISEILREVSALEDIIYVKNERVLLWIQRVEAQIAEGCFTKYKGGQGL